jgi:hypothetical protein
VRIGGGVSPLADLGEPRKIVGIEITMDEDSVTISQQKYIESILEREGMLDTNPVGMPLDPHIKIAPNPETNEPNRSNAFSQRLGELQFLANMTRPDISYPVNRLGAYTANPSLQHYAALKRILRYLSGTRTFGITYRGSKDEIKEGNLFYTLSDAAFANQDDGKSMSGYVFLASSDSDASGLMCTANTKTNTKTNARGPRECPKRPVYEMR